MVVGGTGALSFTRTLGNNVLAIADLWLQACVITIGHAVWALHVGLAGGRATDKVKRFLQLPVEGYEMLSVLLDVLPFSAC